MEAPMKSRIQEIVIRITVDILRAIEDDGKKILEKAGELHKQIAKEDLPRELGILAKIIELTALEIHYACLQSDIARKYPEHEFCKSLAISIISAIYRIAKRDTLEVIEYLSKNMNRNEKPMYM